MYWSLNLPCLLANDVREQHVHIRVYVVLFVVENYWTNCSQPPGELSLTMLAQEHKYKLGSQE